MLKACVTMAGRRVNENSVEINMLKIYIDGAVTWTYIYARLVIYTYTLLGTISKVSCKTYWLTVESAMLCGTYNSYLSANMLGDRNAGFAPVCVT